MLVREKSCSSESMSEDLLVVDAGETATYVDEC